MLLYLIAFYSTGSLNGSAKQQKFFRERGFTRIRVRDDGKCFSPVYFLFVFHKVRKDNKADNRMHRDCSIPVSDLPFTSYQCLSRFKLIISWAFIYLC